MRLDIRSTNVEVDPSLRAHVEGRLAAALGRFSGRLRRVSVRVAVSAGPHGSEGRCRISARVDGLAAPVVVEDVKPLLAVAIARAAERGAAAIGRRLAVAGFEP